MLHKTVKKDLELFYNFKTLKKPLKTVITIKMI